MVKDHLLLKEGIRKKASGGIRSHDIWIMRHVLYRSPTSLQPLPYSKMNYNAKCLLETMLQYFRATVCFFLSVPTNRLPTQIQRSFRNRKSNRNDEKPRLRRRHRRWRRLRSEPPWCRWLPTFATPARRRRRRNEWRRRAASIAFQSGTRIKTIDHFPKTNFLPKEIEINFSIFFIAGLHFF